MNAYDWLRNLPIADMDSACKVVEVSFSQGTRKDFYRNTTLQQFEKGDLVAVEGVSGFDVGEISLTGEIVRLQLKKRGGKEDNPEMRKVLRRATEVGAALRVPVMIHMGQTVSPLSKLLPLMRAGDIVTHMYAPPPNSIIDDNGRILPEVLAARRRGVWFDVGNGQTGHMRWDIVERIMKAGFWPDSFSTDWNANSKTTGVIDFPNCMSKLLGYGMSVEQAVARATVNPARMFPLFQAAPESVHMFIATIGGITALLAASIGVVSTDIKRVLAYSTVSQLGYMVMALGLGGYVAAIFHLFTHAFFKALLFLGSGSVNHASGTFDMRKMGGLRSHMPITFWTFVIGSLSLSGVFPLAGFWSKDEILATAFEANPIFFGITVLVAFMTAFYMFRAIFLTFFGDYKGGAEPEDGHGGHASHPHESPRSMVAPLMRE